MITYARPLYSCLLISVFLFQAGCSGIAKKDWQTPAERSNFQRTATYDETIKTCRQLQAASRWVRLEFIGTTPEGRPMPLLILSRDLAISPKRAHALHKPVVLISNGIHAGEIEGKDASLALARDIAVNKSRAALLDHVTLLILPIFNIDGHERVSPYNRINQDGPQNMGWRCTSQNLNLNRDFMKADAPEMRAWLTMFHSWKPDLLIDTHTTDGADFQYDITFAAPEGDQTAPSVSDWVRQKLEPHLLSTMKADGYVPQIFFDMIDRLDPSKGITDGGLLPRFCTGYAAINNRPGILVETHMIKPFATRLKATYQLLVRTLELINADPRALLDAVHVADTQTAAIAHAAPPNNHVVITTTQPAGDPGEPITFKGYDYRLSSSPASGAEYPVWDHARPVDVPSHLLRGSTAYQQSPMPLAYIIPPQWTQVIDRLTLHGLPCRRLKAPLKLKVESVKFKNTKWREKAFEGRHEASYEFDPIVETREYPAGSVVVSTDTPLAKLALHLLDPAAPDALLRWGFFDAIFEQKEYFEDYVMAPLADKMLSEQPGLQEQFDKWLGDNPAAAKDARARLEFFYKRSPYWDTRKDVYPVGWITDGSQLELQTTR